MYVVTVDFTVAPGQADAFLAAMIANARTSREVEPGCRQFDVCVDPEDPLRVFLYERYADEEAFAAHKTSAHFRRFDAQVKDWVVDKVVRIFARRDPR
jgi:quinol monooxygenase YgiN